MIKETIPFTYKEIYDDISNRFTELGYDAEHEGSNVSHLCNIIAYTLSNFNFNTAVNINETLLDLATKHKNILQDARMLGYERRKATSATIKLKLTNIKTGKVTIPKFTSFTINSKNYTYLGEPVTFSAQRLYKELDLILTEGIVVRNEQYPDMLTYKLSENQEYIDIPFDDIEEDGLFISATFFKNGILHRNVELKKSDFSLIDYNDDMNYYYLRKDDIKTGNCRVYFRVSKFSSYLPADTVLTVSFLRTSGSQGNVTAPLNITLPTNYIDFFTIMSAELLTIGTDGDTDQNIKERAPILYNAANRAVTSQDFKIILSSHKDVYDASVWGGEDDYPRRKGIINVSLRPNIYLGQYGFLNSDTETNYASNYDGIQYIYNNLYIKDESIQYTPVFGQDNRYIDIISILYGKALPSLKYYFKAPTYLLFDIKVDIKKYPVNIPVDELRNKVMTVISNYFNQVVTFNSEIVTSNLLRRIDDELGDHIGVNIEMDTYFQINSNHLSRVLTEYEETDNFNIKNCFAKQTVLGSTLVIDIILPTSANVDDTIDIVYSRKLNDKDTETLVITQQDIDNKYLKLTREFVQRNIIEVKLTDYLDSNNTLESIDLMYKDIDKRIVYYYEEKVDNFHSVYVGIPKFGRINDKIKIKGKYKDIEEIKEIKTVTVDDNTIKNQFVPIDISSPDTSDRILKVDEIIVEYYSELKPEVSLQTKKLMTSSSLVSLTQQDQYPKVNDPEQMTHRYTVKDNTANIFINLPQSAKAGDILTILADSYELQQYELTQQDIDARSINPVLALETKLIKSLSYTSANGEKVKVYDYSSRGRRDGIRIVEDDTLAYNLDNTTYTIKYNDKKSNLGQANVTRLKQNNTITIFNNIVNKIDVRSLFDNWDQEKYAMGIHQVEVLSAEDNFHYEYPWITIKNPKKNEFFSLYVNFYNNSELTSSTIPIIVNDYTRSEIHVEGDGGSFTYLPLPVEDIFDDNDMINLDLLPKLYSDRYEVKMEYNEESLRNMFSSIVTMKEIEDKTINMRYLDYIRFYIVDRQELDVNDKNPIVGTYTLYNINNPYILIKFTNKAVEEMTRMGHIFRVTYPSNNFKFVRNTIPLLRSITFIDSLRDN